MILDPARQPDREIKGNGVPAPKRILDVMIAVAGSTIALPIFCVLAIAIVVEAPGPIVYSQVRLGRKGRLFRMHKLRSMIVDAERETGPVWASDGDPRTTRVGAFMRRLHLDELPQLINVLRGEMSIVGPRPERPSLAERLATAVPGYADRCDVLPGITGLAQVRCGYDRSLRTVRRKLRYDRCYMRRYGSVWMDLKIIAATPAVMLQGGGSRRSGQLRRSPRWLGPLRRQRKLSREEA